MKKAMKKVMSMGLCLSMALTGLSVTAQAAEDEKMELNIVIHPGQDAKQDPTLADGDENSVYLAHMFEGLTKVDITDETTTLAGNNPNEYLGEIVLGQAESYEYDKDNMVYTFHLRDDIFWTDGQPVTAQDFVYSWQRLVDPTVASSLIHMLNGVVENATEITEGEKEPSELGITAVDDKTLTIQMANPCSYFMELLSQKNLVPLRKDIVETGDNWVEPENVVSNGAYRLTEWVHDGHLTMEKDDNYYESDRITVDKITFHMSGDDISTLAAYRAGDYDYVHGVATDQIEELSASGDLFINPTLGMTYCYMNMEKISDWRVRAAMILAVDLENIAVNVKQDGSIPATGLIPGGYVTSEGESWTDYVGSAMYTWLSEQYPEADLETYIGRCELAQELYQAAVEDGWDETTTMTYWYNSNEVNKAIGEAIQSDITNVLGINMILETCDSSTYCATISKGDYYMARLGQGGDYSDPIYYFTVFGTNGDWEYSGFSNATYDEMFVKAQSLDVGPERDEILKDMEYLMFTDECFSVCPLYFSTTAYCVNSELQNLVFYPINGRVFFGYVTK